MSSHHSQSCPFPTTIDLCDSLSHCILACCHSHQTHCVTRSLREGAVRGHLQTGDVQLTDLCDSESPLA